ncbi:MAG TPA: hypothetical protein VHM70_18870 [Polyangiaceae bacterium]|nr:hypothetical protein [Polyangiaceae bacterium]
MQTEGEPSDRSVRVTVGALRDALGSIGNLHQLLRSRSVGPKALGNVLPDVISGAEPLLTQAQHFKSAPHSPFADILGQLNNVLVTELGEFSNSLRPLSKRSLSAATRLKAEQVAARATRQLGSLLALLELVAEAQTAYQTRAEHTARGTHEGIGQVDCVEALSQSRSGDQTPGPGSVQVPVLLNVTSAPKPIALTPRGALSLASVIASLLAQRNQTLRFTFDAAAERSRMKVENAAESANEVSGQILLWVPPLLDVTRACLHAVTGALALKLSIEPTSVNLEW